jgi:hypothetical protein
LAFYNKEDWLDVDDPPEFQHNNGFRNYILLRKAFITFDLYKNNYFQPISNPNQEVKVSINEKITSSLIQFPSHCLDSDSGKYNNITHSYTYIYIYVHVIVKI